MKYQFPLLTAIIAAILLVVTGCSDMSSTVPGRVTLDGEPLKKGIITFRSTEISGRNYQSDIKDGRFSVDIHPGKYRVRISARERVTGEVIDANPGQGASPEEQYKETLPARYNNNTELIETITGNSMEEFHFNLVSGNQKSSGH